jgi:hypothetical protein
MAWGLLAAAFDLRVPSPLRIALCLMAAVALMVALGFAAYAGCLALAAHMAAPWAAAIVAGSALLTAVILIASVANMNRRPAPRVAPRVATQDIPPEAFAELVHAFQSLPKEAARSRWSPASSRDSIPSCFTSRAALFICVDRMFGTPLRVTF